MEAEIRNQVEENFGKKNLMTHCEMVKETLKNRDLITVFEFSIGGRGSSKDIDRAILQALLRGESLGESNCQTYICELASRP